MTKFRKYRDMLGFTKARMATELNISRVYVTYLDRGYDGKGKKIEMTFIMELAIWCLLYERREKKVGDRWRERRVEKESC